MEDVSELGRNLGLAIMATAVIFFIMTCFTCPLCCVTEDPKDERAEVYKELEMAPKTRAYDMANEGGEAEDYELDNE